MNTKTHYLGKPCRRGHINETGMTVRRKDNGSCPACVAIKNKEIRTRRIKLHGATYSGTPCLKNHVNEEGKTIRWSYGGMCIECSKVFKRNYNQSAAGQKSQRESHWRANAMPTPTRSMPEGCEICGRKNHAGKVLVNDHCHGTNKFRGWLCTSCNASLGHLGDTVLGLQRAMDYLQKNTPAV